MSYYIINFGGDVIAIPIVTVVGPTASGKTALSIHLAKRYNAQIVSADSMQIYKEMDIATAKPTVEEMQGIKHHMIDIIECSDSFSVAQYVERAKGIIEDIHNSGSKVILVGGTGLYVNSLVDNILFDDTVQDTALRKRLTDIAADKGATVLHNMLRQVDAVSADRIHENNLPRVVRAIEYHTLTGKPLSLAQEESRLGESLYTPLEIGIDYLNRATLYDRINFRVDSMVEQGLIEEARYILSKDNLATGALAIGYKELLPYFNGLKPLEQCLDDLKQSSRRYAKRQLTWFRKRKSINWFYADSYKNIGEMYNEIEGVCDRFFGGEAGV